MKCYVCKFVNAAAEYGRHPNAVTLKTAQLLQERMRRHHQENRDWSHTCPKHQDSTQRSIDIQRAHKDISPTPRKEGGR